MKVVSLFSGAGGLDLGLVQSGHQIVWANDIFSDAASTYELNFGHKVDRRDIREVDSSDIPESDVVVGGFPCQGFSQANRTRSIHDPRNELYRQFVRVVHDTKPRYFLAENVKGLLTMAKGQVLRQIVTDFEGCGYKVVHSLVNSADYGVPQKRIRVIILGVRKDIKFFPDAFPPKATHVDPSTAIRFGLEPWLSVGEALAHLPEPGTEHSYSNHEYSKYKLRFNGHLGHRFVDPTSPAPTVTSRGDDKGGVVVLHHPGNHRRMTARELATVQSFPDDFKFVGTMTSAYRQISNAVPPGLARALGRMLMEMETLSLAAESHAA